MKETPSLHPFAAKARQTLRVWAPALVLACALAATQYAFNEAVGMGIARAKRPLLTVAGTSLLMAAPLLLLRRRGTALAYAAMATFVLNLLAWSNIAYERQFHAALSARLLSQTGNLDGLGPSIWGLTRSMDLIFAALALFTPWIVAKFFSGRGRQRVGCCALATAGLMLHGTIHVKNAIVYQRNPFIMSFDSVENAAAFTLPLYHVLDAVDAATTQETISLSLADRERIRLWSEQHPDHGGAQRRSLPYGVARGKNLLLVQWEAFELSALDLQVGGTEVTPHFNRFFHDSLGFTEFHAQVGHGNTSDAELATLASLYPLPQGSAFFRLPENRYLGLPRLLNAAGYRTLAFHGNAASFWNRGIAWPALGFERFFDKSAMRKAGFGNVVGMGIDDHDAVGFLLATVKATPSPWFAFFVTLTSHTPFSLPAGLAPEPHEISGMVGDYLRALRYADLAFGTLLDGLKAQGRWDDTVIAVYGDHEAVVGDIRGDAVARGLPSFGRNRGRVPLAIRVPGSERAHFQAEIPSKGAQIDTLPTLAHLLGVRSDAALGRNLLATSTEGAMHPFGHWFGGEREEWYREGLWVSERILRSCHQVSPCGTGLLKRIP